MPTHTFITVTLRADNEVGRIARSIGEVEQDVDRRGDTYEIIVGADGNVGQGRAQRAPAPSLAQGKTE